MRIKQTYREQLKEQKTSPFGKDVGLTCDVKKLDKAYPDEFWYNKHSSSPVDRSQRGKPKTPLFANPVSGKIEQSRGRQADLAPTDTVYQNTQHNASIGSGVKVSSLVKSLYGT